MERQSVVPVLPEKELVEERWKLSLLFLLLFIVQIFSILKFYYKFYWRNQVHSQCHVKFLLATARSAIPSYFWIPSHLGHQEHMGVEFLVHQL